MRWHFALPVHATRESASRSDHDRANWPDEFAGAPPTLEHRARWRIVANFFRYLQIAERRKPAASPIAKTELGGGDGISGHEVAAIESANFWSRVLITIWCRVSGAAQDAMNKAMTIAIQ
jgi:hypothetical protein